MCRKRNKNAERQLFVINTVILPLIDTVKYLGTLNDSQLKVDLHINFTVAKANARACLIFRCFVSKDRVSIIKAFITYVRPLIEYVSCVWTPNSVRLIRKIEAVQKRFTKRLPGLEVLEYHERLTILGLESLELRRLQTDLRMTYTILFSIVNLYSSESFFSIRTKQKYSFTPVKHLQSSRKE